MRMIILALCLAATTFASDADIQAAEKKWASAVAANDMASLGKILGDQLIYAHSTGVVETKSEYLGKLKSGEQQYAGIEHTKITVKEYGNTAVAHCFVRMHGKNTKTGPFDNKLMMLHVWQKGAAGWQLVAHQTTRLP